jgi:hypothetical protein
VIGYGSGLGDPCCRSRPALLPGGIGYGLSPAGYRGTGWCPNVHQISPPAVVTASNGRIPPPLFRRHLYRYGVRANGLGG